MTTIYKGEDAKRVCGMILANDNYDTPLKGYDHLSAGYWKEDGKWIAYDNTTGDCWVEEFETRRQAAQYAEGL